MASSKSKEAAEVKKAAPKSSGAPAKKGGNSGKKGKPGIVERAKTYFAGVKSEIKRVVWPTREELVKYTAAVVGMLLFFGILIAIVDAAVIPALYAFSGLRG